MFFKLLVLGAALTVVRGYSSGAPLDPEVCQTLVPKHPGTPQTGPSPYTVQVDRNQVSPGEMVQVTIASDGTTPFKGFLAQGRKLNYDVETGSQGIFLTDNNPEFKSLSCDNDYSSVTHTHSQEKNRVVLTWKAPEEPGTYVILATVVQNGKVYWVRQPSEGISVV